MSQRTSASRPASRSPPDGQRITLPPVQFRDDREVGGQTDRQLPGSEIRRAPSRPHSSNRQSLPSQVTAGDDWRSAPTRDLGVYSILNPSEPEGASASTRRHSGPGIESPRSVVGPSPHFVASPSTTYTFPGQQQPSGTPIAEGYAGTYPRGRRILNPRSPSRAVSTGRVPTPSQGNTDAQRSPFLPARGRAYIAEPGPSPSSEIPAMPTPPAHLQHQSHYGFPSVSGQTISARRASAGTMAAPARTPLSESASPSISASSHNPPSSQTSPASHLYHKGGQQTQTTTSYYPGSSFNTQMQQGGVMQFQGPPGAPEGPYSAPDPQSQGSSFHSSSAGSSRQTSATDSIQVLTITTSQGSYTVPVDVHQASRLADEKRARNAGASARFRQRRKEKEKESTTAIEKLQSTNRDIERKLREAEVERDFFRADRDRLRDVIYRTPELRHHAMQGPPSPRSMRTTAFHGPPPPQMGFQAPDSHDERASRRRRTSVQSDFTPVYSPSTAPPLPSAPPGYPAGSNLPPLRIDNPNAAQTPSSKPPATTAGPQIFDPYSRGPYERGWPSDGRQR
jgi:hypothetical protein